MERVLKEALKPPKTGPSLYSRATQLGKFKTKQGPRISFRSKLLSKRVREARSADLLRRAIRNDFPFGMHFNKRGLRGATAQIKNPRRNKVPD